MFKIKGAILMTEIDDGEGKRMPDYIYIFMKMSKVYKANICR